MLKKILKRGGALIMAAAVCGAALILSDTYASIAVENDRVDCSIEVNVSGSDFKEIHGMDETVKAVPVEIHLYKVADISVSGTYSPLEAYESVELSGLNETTTAQDWELIVESVMSEIENDGTEPVAVGETVDGTYTFANLETGLYLIDAQQALSDNYQYDFTPYLVSLPNNYFYTTEDDTWFYELTGDHAVGLKPEKSDRYGDLVINKFLDVYNETIGGATFVFQIEGTKTDVDTGETKVVYSDVISMTFNGTGTDSYVIEDIPAGSVVTVTEIYSGGSYQLISDGAQTVTIIADPAEDEAEGETASETGDGEAAGPVEVSFANTYDYRLNGGTGLVNSFIYNSDDQTWTHQATTDSTP